MNDTVENLKEFFKGELVLYHDIPVKKNKVYDCLVEYPSEHDGYVILILSVIIPALSTLKEHQCGDHLPASVDKRSKFSDRILSYVDHVLAAKPNIKTLKLEAQIKFSLNKQVMK